MADVAQLPTVSEEDFNKSVVKASHKLEIKKAVDSYLYNSQNGMGKRDEILIDLQTLIRSGDKSEKTRKKINDALLKYTIFDAANSGDALANSVHVDDAFKTLAAREDLIKEYDANSPTQKMTIDLAVNAYFRALRLAKTYIRLITTEGNGIVLDHLKIAGISQIRRQIDAAFQQYFMAISFLKDFNRPPVNVKLHAKQAFVGQNQQFNSKS